MSDVVCRSWADDHAARTALLAAHRKLGGRRKALYPPFYQVDVSGGEAIVHITVTSHDFTIEQAKQLQRHLGEAIAAAEANVGRADQPEDDDFYVSCLIGTAHLIDP